MTLPAQLDQAALDALLQSRDDLVLVDVRSPDECAASPREGSVNWPLDDLSDHLAMAEPGQCIVFACKTGQRAKQARGYAKMLGFTQIACLVP